MGRGVQHQHLCGRSSIKAEALCRICHSGVFNPVFPAVSLEHDGDCDPDAGARAVVYVIPIVGVIKIYVVGVVPIFRPRFRPRINECDPIAVVLEAWIPAYENQWEASDAEEVVTSEVGVEACVGNTVAIVAAALAPSAVVAIPVART